MSEAAAGHYPGRRAHRLRLRDGLARLRSRHGGQRHRPARGVSRTHPALLGLREAADPCGGPARGGVLLGAGAVLPAGAACQPERPGVPALPARGADRRHRPGAARPARRLPVPAGPPHLRGLRRRRSSSSCRPTYGSTARPAGSTPCICCGCWPAAAICSARACSRWTSAQDREELLAVRRGEVAWSDGGAPDGAAGRGGRGRGVRLARCRAEPDRARVEDFLFRARRASALG